MLFRSDCGGCAFHGKCGYCPGISHAETGDAGRRSTYVCERTHLTMAAIDYAHALREAGLPLPAPGTPEAVEMFERFGPTFAERQLAARRAGAARPRDGLRDGAAGGPLVQIGDPRIVTR